MEKLKKYQQDTLNVNSILYTTQAETYYNYIELADIGHNGEINRKKKLATKDLSTRARRMVKNGDLIVSSVEGSLSACAIVPKELSGAPCLTGFYIITPSKNNVETLLMLFKTPQIQNLIHKVCSGSILTSISEYE